MKAHDSRLRTVATTGFFLVAAGTVVFFGLRGTEGQPRDDVRPLPSGFVALTLPPQAMVPEPLDAVTIEGEQVALARGLVAGRFCVSEGGGCFTMVSYTPPGSRSPTSSIHIDDTGRVIKVNVTPEDESRFSALLAGAVLPTATPLPTVLINGSYVQVDPGIELNRTTLSNTGGKTNKGWVLTFLDAKGLSRVYVDNAGSVVSVDIKPGHESLFQSITTAANTNR